jgi:hypothetical protein
MNITIVNNETGDRRFYQDITQIEEVDEYTVNLYGVDGSLVDEVDQEIEIITI